MTVCEVTMWFVLWFGGWFWVPGSPGAPLRWTGSSLAPFRGLNNAPGRPTASFRGNCDSYVTIFNNFSTILQRTLHLSTCVATVATQVAKKVTTPKIHVFKNHIKNTQKSTPINHFKNHPQPSQTTNRPELPNFPPETSPRRDKTIKLDWNLIRVKNQFIYR